MFIIEKVALFECQKIFVQNFVVNLVSEGSGLERLIAKSRIKEVCA